MKEHLQIDFREESRNVTWKWLVQFFAGSSHLLWLFAFFPALLLWFYLSGQLAYTLEGPVKNLYLTLGNQKVSGVVGLVTDPAPLSGKDLFLHKFRYSVNGEVIEGQCIIPKSRRLLTDDSVTIEYSTLNPNIARIESSHWNNFRFLEDYSAPVYLIVALFMPLGGVLLLARPSRFLRSGRLTEAKFRERKASNPKNPSQVKDYYAYDTPTGEKVVVFPKVLSESEASEEQKLVLYLGEDALFPELLKPELIRKEEDGPWAATGRPLWVVGLMLLAWSGSCLLLIGLTAMKLLV